MSTRVMICRGLVTLMLPISMCCGAAVDPVPAGGSPSVTAPPPTSGGPVGGGTGTGTGGSTSAGLSGIVRDTSGAVRGGGFVQILSGSATVRLLPIAANGTFAFDSLTAGGYQLRYHPPGGFSVGGTDTGSRPITIGATPVVANFIAIPALFYDDFQSYADSADLLRNFPKAYKSSMIVFQNNPSQITLDQTGGPNFTKAMRYNIPARPGNCTNYAVNFQPYWKTNEQIDSVWVRFESRESPFFSNGSASCPGGRSYKFFLAEIGLTTASAGRLGSYILNNDNAHSLYLDMNDRVAYAVASAGIGSSRQWSGFWSVWLVHITGIGTSNSVFEMFRDGVLVQRLTGIFNTQPDPKHLVSIELGANINHGPDTPQQRWFREVGVFRSRPSTLSVGNTPLP